MTTPSGDEGADGNQRPDPQPTPRRVRRHTGSDQPAARWERPDSERDEIWGDPPPDNSEQLRRDVPPHHGG